MKILVTGTSGRIGRAIYSELSGDHEVSGLDQIPGDATTILGDITNEETVARSMAGADAVIHTAALHAPHVGLESEETFQRVNVEGTVRIARAAMLAGVREMVFTSTTALYGAGATSGEASAWVDENTAPQPRTVYHRTKLEAEAKLESLACDRFRITVLRMSRCFPESAPMMACYRLHRGVDARDVASAHRAVLGRAGPSFSRYVVSGNTPFVRDDIEGLTKAAPKIIRRRCPELAATFDAQGWKLPASIDRIYDSSLLQDSVSWRPRYGWQEVIKQWCAGSSEVLSPESV